MPSMKAQEFDQRFDEGEEIISALDLAQAKRPNDETPTEIVIEGIYQGLREALSGQTIPLSEMWEGIDVD